MSTPSTSSGSGEASRFQPVAPFRRIITSHESSDMDGCNVTIFDDDVVPVSVLAGGAYIKPLFSHPGLPAVSSHSISPEEIQAAADAAPDVVRPDAVNARVTDLAPGFKVDYHRTSSIDYNILVAGSATLITPLSGGKEKRTVVKAGEIVIQRGTLHAWEAGEEGARWYTVVVAALPVKVGDKEGKELRDVDF